MLLGNLPKFWPSADRAAEGGGGGGVPVADGGCIGCAGGAVRTQVAWITGLPAEGGGPA